DKPQYTAILIRYDDLASSWDENSARAKQQYVGENLRMVAADVFAVQMDETAGALEFRDSSNLHHFVFPLSLEFVREHKKGQRLEVEGVLVSIEERSSAIPNKTDKIWQFSNCRIVRPLTRLGGTL